MWRPEDTDDPTRPGYPSPRMLDRRALTSALVLAVAVIACTPAPSPSPSLAATQAGSVAPTEAPSAEATLAPLPTAADTGSAGTPPCLVADLKASHGLVEGAAGSRLTEVILVSSGTCSIDAYPTLGLRNADGAALLGGPAIGPGAIDLVPGVANVSQVRLSNWCAPEPAFPLELEVIVDGAELPVTGGSFPEDGDLPPCTGDGGPVLEGSAWLPQP
jgi:hypothetical protein